MARDRWPVPVYPKCCRDGAAPRTDEMCRYCSLIQGFGVKLSVIILAGPTVLSAVGACLPLGWRSYAGSCFDAFRRA
jgi:hypothetical protein